MRFLFVAVFAAAIIGCQSVPVSSHDFCLVAKPITISRKDVLTDITKHEILSHDQTGVAICHWNPRSG